jgi:CBS domain-containing protein
MAHLSELLVRRTPVVHVMRPDASVAEAVVVMARWRVGAVPIVARSRLVGIFSERDLLRRVVAQGRDASSTPLREVMTPEPVTASPEEDRLEAVLKMQRVGCRHLPIVADGEVIDMLSMRDLLFSEIEERSAEIDDLKRYIAGSY